MSLPKGFKRLEFIQSTGTQRINTGFVPNQNTRVVMDVKFSTAPTVLLSSLFGAIDANDDQLWCWYWKDKSSFYFRYKATSNIAVSGTSTERNVIDLNGPTLTIGDASATAPSATFTLTSSLYLFAVNHAGSAEQPGSFCLYSCQIYDNGTLVRDYIPCQNASGAVGLWDAVNEVFYGNDGTGTFTAGPVVPEIVDESEITELEYIQSSGTQYVDTMFKPNQDTRVLAEIYCPLNSGSFCGAIDLTNTRYGVYAGATYRNDYNTSLIDGLSTNLTGKFVLDKNKNVQTVNGVSATAPYAQFSVDASLYLFAFNVSGAANYFGSGIKLYSCQIFDTGLLERDYIPAMLENGEVGLYDRVYYEFYRNAGTGEFIAGPEMVHEGYTELEYVESNGTQYMDTGWNVRNEYFDKFRIDLDIAYTQLVSVNGGKYAIMGTGNHYFGYSIETRQFMISPGASASYDFVPDYTFNTDRALIVYDLYNREVKYNGVLIGTPRHYDREQDGNFQLFGNSDAPTTYARVYGAKIYISGVLQNGLIPKLHPSGVAGLWDSVNERFYASATTTDFIAGPEAQTVPKAPANFRVEVATDTMVTLAWDASDKALGYRLYRPGQFLADTTETSISVAVEPFAGAVFILKAYNENGEGAGATLTHYSIPENPLLYLITDRTAQDVTERNPKGYYAASDLNRVGYAMDYLANIIRGYGYTLEVHTKTDWTDEGWKLTGEMVKYLQSLNNLKGVFSTLVELPENMEKIDYRDANNIEQLLRTIDETIVRVVAGFTRANAYGLRSGAKGLPASQSDRGRNWGQLDAIGTTWANWQLATWYLLLYGNLKAEGVVE